MSRPALILASTSPYRRELLSRLGLSFTTVAPNVDESRFTAESPRALACLLAARKAREVAARHPGSVVIGSDQVVDLDGEVLGKPGTADKARRQLGRLAGRSHELITAVVAIDPEGEAQEIVVSHTMTLRALTGDEIASYVARDSPLDCAGSYKIESLGIALFRGIDGADFTAITGLPLVGVTTLLRAVGLNPLTV